MKQQKNLKSKTFEKKLRTGEVQHDIKRLIFIKIILSQKPMSSSPCFTYFKASIKNITLPDVFTFPFYYDPHPLALLAAKELQNSIESEIDWEHNFGLEKGVSGEAYGKMFGVLVVQNKEGEIGYLSGFSGKLEGRNPVSNFVPPIYDRFGSQSFYTLESIKLDLLSKQINKLEADPLLATAKQVLETKKKDYAVKLLEEKRAAKKYSNRRKQERKQFKLAMDEDAYQELYKSHIQESINDKSKYKAYAEYIDLALARFQHKYDLLNDKIIKLKNKRKIQAKELQEWLFSQYNFFNSHGETKNVITLFRDRIPNVPPSGSGDCAAPKLMQYAFQKGYKPIALAEFWWGKEPSSKVRKHQYFYPACRGKCGPILNHMLVGLKVAPNPLLTNPALGKKLKTIYEDQHLVVVNKPAGFLSVPGKYVRDSVQERMLEKHPDATGPLIVHRLDMSTSGLMVIAKSKIVHKTLQENFRVRRVTKRYVALLDGNLEKDKGFIDLPLRVDHDNRPFQIVCYEHGKACRTKWEVIERTAKYTKVYFYPLSGRTHQLRVHAAHKDGLNMPIVGDDLYGLKKDRLYLHAEAIAFEHPVTKEKVGFEVGAEF